MTSSVRPRRAWGRSTAMLLLMTCLVVPATSSTAAAATTRHAHHKRHARHARHRAHHRSSRGLAVLTPTLPVALNTAAKRARGADRILVADAKALKRCLHGHHKRCRAARGAVQRAGTQLARAQRSLARIVYLTDRVANATREYASWRARQAPQLTASGQSLRWTRVARIETYVLARRVPGESAQYALVRGTSTTPPPVPGLTVDYSVRTTARGSAWSAEQPISYGSTPATTDPQSAPALSVSGYTLTWSAIDKVTTYVLMSKAPGHPAQYSVVSGTSFTPAPVPGATVKYSLRTAVEGSAWAPEVAITYPAVTAPVTPPVTAPPAPGSPGSMLVSLNAGGWGSQGRADVASVVNTVRVSAGSESNVAPWTSLGVKVIALRAGPYNSGGVSALNASEWASEATSWVRANPQVLAVEVLNEPGGNWFWGSNAESSANRLAYAHLLEVVHADFVSAFGSKRPLILASYDGGHDSSVAWGEGWWPHVNPEAVDGVTVHPYGGNSGFVSGSRAQAAEGNRAQVTKAHEQTGKPVYVTELGWPTCECGATSSSSQWSGQEQAANITSFVTWARSTGYVADVTIFGYRDYGASGPTMNFGIETWGGRRKPAYAALQKVAAE